MLPADPQAAWDEEDAQRLLRATLDAERRHEEAVLTVNRIRQELAKAKRKRLEASWDETNARVAWLRSTAHLRTDAEGLPLTEPERSIEISRRNAARADEAARPKAKAKGKGKGPAPEDANGEGSA